MEAAPTRTPTSWRRGPPGACVPGSSWTTRGARSEPTTACTASRSGSARAWASRSASPRSSRASTLPPPAAPYTLGSAGGPQLTAAGFRLVAVVGSAEAMTLPLRARVRVRYDIEGEAARSSRLSRGGHVHVPSCPRARRGHPVRPPSSTTTTGCWAGATIAEAATVLPDGDRRHRSRLRYGTVKSPPPRWRVARIQRSSRRSPPSSPRRARFLGNPEPARAALPRRRTGLLGGPLLPAPQLLRGGSLARRRFAPDPHPERRRLPNLQRRPRDPRRRRGRGARRPRVGRYSSPEPSRHDADRRPAASRRSRRQESRYRLGPALRSCTRLSTWTRHAARRTTPSMPWTR